MGAPQRRTLGFWALLIYTFSAVGGGASASESMLGIGGLFICLASVVLFPLLWGFITAAITVELAVEYGNSDGGILIWINELFEAPRTALNVSVWILAMNAATTVASAEFSLDYIATAVVFDRGYWITVGLNALFVVCGLAVNMISIGAVNRTCWACAINGLLAFGTLVALASVHISRHGRRRDAVSDQPPLRDIDWGSLLNILAFNSCGYESVSNVITHVKSKKTVSYAMLAAAAAITSLYIVSLTVPYMASSAPHTAWVTGYFAVLGRDLGGPALQWWLIVSCVLTNFQTFSVSLQGSARIVASIAERGHAPRVLGTRSANGTPRAALLVTSVLSLLCALLPLRLNLAAAGVLYALVVLAEIAACVGAKHARMRFLPQSMGARALLCLPTLVLALFLMATQDKILLVSTFGCIFVTAAILRGLSTQAAPGGEMQMTRGPLVI